MRVSRSGSGSRHDASCPGRGDDYLKGGLMSTHIASFDLFSTRLPPRRRRAGTTSGRETLPQFGRDYWARALRVVLRRGRRRSARIRADASPMITVRWSPRKPAHGGCAHRKSPLDADPVQITRGMRVTPMVTCGGMSQPPSHDSGSARRQDHRGGSRTSLAARRARPRRIARGLSDWTSSSPATASR